MERFTTSRRPQPTAFRSVYAEEAAKAKAARREEWENEDGNITARSGYIMRTPDAALAFKVVLDHEVGPDTEHACGTIEECRAIIRRNTRYMTSAHQGRFAL